MHWKLHSMLSRQRSFWKYCKPNYLTWFYPDVSNIVSIFGFLNNSSRVLFLIKMCNTTWLNFQSSAQLILQSVLHFKKMWIELITFLWLVRTEIIFSSFVQELISWSNQNWPNSTFLSHSLSLTVRTFFTTTSKKNLLYQIFFCFSSNFLSCHDTTSFKEQQNGIEPKAKS